MAHSPHYKKRMAATYLVRFDDICPTMNWDTWEGIETTLLREGVKPILAVVPDNQDPKLNVANANPQFWQRVRQWQKNGWSIAIHGYQHVYDSPEPGILGLNAYSEFAGLTFDRQLAKLTRALQIFGGEGILPSAWIAPAHSFDETTIRALRDLGIRVLSDGFYLRPSLKLGMVWVPQQLWRFRQMPVGMWTVCLHHNHWSQSDLERFDRDVRQYRHKIISLADVLVQPPNRAPTFLDEAFAMSWLLALRIKGKLKNAARHV